MLLDFYCFVVIVDVNTVVASDVDGVIIVVVVVVIIVIAVVIVGVCCRFC